MKFETTSDGDISDGHHTFKDLYEYRLLYNAALFNIWAKLGLCDVHKSRFHHDGLHPFNDPKWFIVMAELPTGQISNHYKVDDWDLFYDVPERDLPNVYDGHTPADAAQRLKVFLRKGMLTTQATKQSELERLREHLRLVHRNEMAMVLSRSTAERYHWQEHYYGAGEMRTHSHAAGLDPQVPL